MAIGNSRLLSIAALRKFADCSTRWGMKVRDGEGFKPGDRIKDLYLDCEVELREKLDVDGVPLLRLVIPDKQNRWPEESADYPYNMQILSTIALYEFGKN